MEITHIDWRLASEKSLLKLVRLGEETKMFCWFNTVCSVLFILGGAHL